MNDLCWKGLFCSLSVHICHILLFYTCQYTRLEICNFFTQCVSTRLTCPCVLSCVSYRKPTVATVVKGYGGWAGRGTSVSTANCWSISAVTDSILRPAKGLWWVFHNVLSSKQHCTSLSNQTPTQSFSSLANSEIKPTCCQHEWWRLHSITRGYLFEVFTYKKFVLVLGILVHNNKRTTY